MHRKILITRHDIQTVVHAHPKHASFISATKSHRIRTDLLAEARFLLKEPAFAPYALMGTSGLGDIAAAALKDGRVAVILENHGIITLGKTLLQAFDRIEVLEAAAEMTLMSKMVEDLSPLDDHRLKEIDTLSS